MKVQGSAFFFGLEAEAAQAKFPGYFDLLAAGHGRDNEFPIHRPFVEGFAYRRRMFVNSIDDAWCGVVLSARASEFHHYVRKVGNVVEVVPRPNGPDAPVEINFFAIRKDTHKGIYSNYYGSYAFSLFLADLWHGYRFYVERCRDAHIAGLGNGLTKGELVEARMHFALSGRAKYSPLYNPGTFNDLLRELETVAELRMTTYQVDAPEDAPMGRRIHNLHKVYRVHEAQQTADLPMLRWIRSMRDRAIRPLANGRIIRSGSVIGKKPDGEPMTIPFESKMDDFLNFEYDDIGRFDVAKLSANDCIRQMLAKLRGELLFR